MEMICGKNITKSFGEKKVLDGVNVRVAPGEIFGLLGPSGAGKTTLIKILTGQMPADAGTAALLGMPSAGLHRKERGKIGIMMEEFGLYERLSVYDNMKVYANLFGIPANRIDGVLQTVGLREAKKTPAAKLSKGMRTRLRLARPLLLQPALMFLDEPTSGLDPATAEDVHGLLNAFRQKGGTVFLTTHNMTEAEKLCDRVALLNCGTVVEEGQPAALCRKYNSLKTVTLVTVDGETLTLPADASSADTVARVMKEGKLCTVHSSEPNLESVFMLLTGNKLNV